MNQIFNYNGNNITFLIGNGDVMLNAIDMAKAFGKLPNDYLRFPSTKAIIEVIARKSRIAISKRLKRPLTGQMIVNKGKFYKSEFRSYDKIYIGWNYPYVKSRALRGANAGKWMHPIPIYKIRNVDHPKI